jgi:hypothetical protein
VLVEQQFEGLVKKGVRRSALLGRKNLEAREDIKDAQRAVMARDTTAFQ